jgi:hypothetical protein
MSDAQDFSENSQKASDSQLPGFIFYDKTSSGIYGRYSKKTFVKDGKVYHDVENLGRLVNQEIGLFRNRVRGYFTFTLKDGYGPPPEGINPQIYEYPKIMSLDFGDAWMVDQILKQTGLDSILCSLVPGSGDTLKALVSYRLLEPYAYNYAQDWHQNSYAKILYPTARLESQRISDFHEILGSEDIYVKFFTSYLNLISNNGLIGNNISVPILIDSTGLQNDIHTHITAINNHNGVLNNEIRLIYIVDQKTKMPILFRYISGNIIDNSSLITTINTLIAYGIKIEIVIMDAGYAAMKNLVELASANISFLTRMPQNRKEFKQLLAEHGTDLLSYKNAITFGERTLFCKQIPVHMFGIDLYAYLMHDVKKAADDTANLVRKIEDNTENNDNYDYKLSSVGKFVLLSSKDYPVKEILPLYYTRQAIEEVFDVTKTYTNILPLRVHSEEAIRGVLLISFLATIGYTVINQGLSESKISAQLAIRKMHHLKIKIYESAIILDELTKEQKDIFKHLQLECPFQVERGNNLKQDSFLSGLKPKKRKKGRPKGSKNKEEIALATTITPKPDETRRRGRPKGSKNKGKIDSPATITPNPDGTRRRGRPKGSKKKA